MMKILIILAVVGAGGVATVMAVRANGGGEQDPAKVARALFEVARGDLNITITESGTLVAKESQSVRSEIRGRSQIEWLIEEGKSVEEGEVVARLDTTELKKEIEQLELSINQSEADLNTAKTELEIQQTTNESDIEKAQIAVEKAQKEQERYVEGDAPKEKRALEIAIKDAETSHTQREKYYEDSLKLAEEGFINQSQVEEDEILFEKAQVQLEGAQIDLRMFDKYTYPMTLADKENALKDAQRNLETAEKRAASQLRQKQVAVEQVEKRLQKYQEQLQEKKDILAKCELKAPCPGIVIYGDPKEPWYREEIKVGGDLWGSRTIITIPDLRVMQVKLSIHEADVNKLKVGQKVKVTMDTYPGMVLDGDVSKIASIAGSNDPWSNESEVKKFPVEITMGEVTDVKLKPGISAKAEIFIDRLEDTLYVPIQCVFLEEGVHFGYVMGADQVPVRRTVKPGLNNDSYIQILEGLDEGEPVLLYNPSLAAKREEDPGEGDADGEAGDDGAGDSEDGTSPGAGDGAGAPVAAPVAVEEGIAE